MTLVPRVCERCSKAKGTMAFRYYQKDGTSHRGYFHLQCFRELIEGIDE
jgi:hypothetical protein